MWADRVRWPFICAILLDRIGNRKQHMRVVEIRLDPSELSRTMAAMRVWLDQHRFETNRFSCLDQDNGVLLSLEFKQAYQARAFAQHFGGRSAAQTVEELAPDGPKPGLSPPGLIG